MPFLNKANFGAFRKQSECRFTIDGKSIQKNEVIFNPSVYLKGENGLDILIPDNLEAYR